MARFCLLACLCALFLAAGCATQSRPSEVGDVGFNPRHERHLAAKREAENYYTYNTPKTFTIIRSDPAGALVEWHNPEGRWVAIGNTPTREVVIEATGKPELFRVSAPGFLPKTKWVAAMPDADALEVTFELHPAGRGDIILDD